MSLDLLLEAALFLEQQQSKGKEPKECKNASDDAVQAISDRQIPSQPPVLQHLALKASSEGSFYTDERSPSPSTVRDYHSHSQQPWDSAPLYGNGGSICRGYASDGGGGVQYHVDDLPSRSHRLEEALLRATRRTSPLPPGHSAGSRGSPDELLELRKRGGAGTREVHNKLEKNRRAHLRECFEFLRKQLPAVDEKKLSNLGILKNALRHIQTLKRKEREFEHTMERLAREKISLQQRLASLKKEISSIPGYTGETTALDLGSVLPVLHNQNHVSAEPSPLTYSNLQVHNAKYGHSSEAQQHAEQDRESCSTSTASEQGENETEQERQPLFNAGRKRVYAESNGHEMQQPAVKLQPKYSRPGGLVSSSSSPAYVLSSQEGLSSESSGAIFVRQPVTLANGLSSHVQLAPQILSTQAGMQLIGSPLKVALQPLVAVHSQGTKSMGEDMSTASLLNVSATSATGICIPAGVVIPGLVTLSSAESAAGDSRVSQVHSTQQFRGSPIAALNHSSSISSTVAISSSAATETVMNLSNGIIRTSASSRTVSLQPTSSGGGIGHVMTPIGRSLPMVTSVAVMPPNKHVTHILANTSLDKVVTGPLIKAGPIPIISGQYLTPSQLASGRHVIKPLVVVAATPPSPAAPANRTSDTPPS